MSLDTDRLPYFPPELERLIFEVAFTQHGSKCSVKYLLVARRVSIWLKPLIFRVFTQMLHLKFPNFEGYPNSLKVEEVGRFAQRLIIHHSYRKELEKMLFHCPNLQDLAFWVQPIKFLLPTLEKLSLKRISADFADLTHDDYLGTAFSNITHLDVIKFHGRTWKEWEVLSKLPHLSHLLIGSLVDYGVFLNLLRHVSQLRILIFMPEPDSLAAWMQDHNKNQHNLLGNDDRFILLHSPVFPGLIEDWVKGGESGLDNWTFCELVLIARKRNFFLDNSRQFIQRIFDWDKNLTDRGKKWYSELNWRDPWSSDVLWWTRA